ncbi:MAG TPA: DNA replication/repair protein RecF [Gammaproteobacteria bacterium]
MERIRVDRLRILSDIDCALDPRRNYFFGPNGAGKTSLLEAFFVIGRGRSFRTRHTRRLVQHGQNGFSVYIEQRDGERLRRIGAAFDSSGLVYRIDRQPAASVTEVARCFAVDVIDPGVHRLIEGGPSERRRFLDWGVFHVEHDYLGAWKRYRRVLGQRNAALKAGASRAALEPWDHALVEAGNDVTRARSAYVERFAPVAEAVAERLVRRRLEVRYRTGWRAGVELAEALSECLERDRAMGHTTPGPHRADLALRLDGADVADEASRGQQKLCAAALVVAQVRDAGAAGRRDAVLLIDDPAAELDRGSLARLLAEVEDLPAQLILTGLSEDLLPVDRRFPMFHVEQGKVRRVL